MKREIKIIHPINVKDFVTVYKVFREAPYYEDWDDDTIIQEYNDLYSDGFVYGYYLDNECVGLITFRPMKVTDHHPIYYEHPEKVAYFSDFAVLKSHQGKGIGTALMEHMLNVLRKEHYDIVYMKTLQIGKSMSYGIALKHGFKLIEGVTSIDKMVRTVEGISEEDVKIYLDMVL